MHDYVIVGAGSAGCVLAARLSEDPDTSVLLIEAGPPDTNDNIHVPLGYLKLAGTEVDWHYWSAPEPECDERRLPLPRGRVLGGSSSVNAMVYIRGNHRDYDEWGAPGWSWDEPLPLLPAIRGQRARRVGVARGRRAASGQRSALGDRDPARVRRGGLSMRVSPATMTSTAPSRTGSGCTR